MYLKRIELSPPAGRLEDEDEIFLQNGEFGSIGRKLDGVDLSVKSVGSEDDLAQERDEESVAVFVDTD